MKYLDFYKAQGLCTIPIPYKTKVATLKWEEYQRRLPTDEKMEEWFSKDSTNVAIICGAISKNLVILDCDSPERFYNLAATICEKVGCDDILDYTLVSETGRGLQIWLRTEAPVKSQKFPLLDIKGEGGYIIAPPSIHPNGKQYKFLNETVPVKVIPDLKAIGIDTQSKPTVSSSQPGWVSQALRGVGEGGRNDTCLRLAGYFKNKHPQDITERLLLDWNSKNKPPLPEREILSTLRSAYSYPVKTSTRVKTLSDISQSTAELPNGLWGDFLFKESIVLFSGESGCGKTTFLYNLAAALSIGDSYLGFKIPQPLTILYYDLESPEPLIKRRTSLIELQNQSSVSIGRLENFREEYKRLVEEARGFDVVILDPISLAFQTADEDSNAEASRQMNLLRKFVIDTGCCFIVLHHMGKSQLGKKGIYKARGASARAALSDVVINFEGLTEDVCRFEVGKNRFIGGCSTFFVEKLEGQFELTTFQGYTDSIEIFKAQERIIEFLRGKLEDIPRKDILSALEKQGLNRVTIDRAFAPLLQAGKIWKPRYGHYRLKGDTQL